MESKKINFQIEKIINNNINFINLFSFQLRRFFSSFSTLMIFSFPFIVIFSVMTFLSPTFFYVAALSGTLLFSTFFVFGFYYVDLNNSNLFNSLKISRKRIMILGSVFLLILISNFISFFLCIFYITIFNLIFNFNSITESIPINGQINITTVFINSNWYIAVYYFIVFTISTFLFAFFLKSFLKTSEKYFMTCSVYIILTIFFGGVFSTNEMLRAQNVFENSYVQNGEIFIYPNYWLIINNDNSLFPFVFSNLIPIFYLNIFAQYMFTGMETMNPEIINGEIIQAGTQVNFDYFNLKSNFTWGVIFIPYFWIILFGLFDIYFLNLYN